MTLQSLSRGKLRFLCYVAQVSDHQLNHKGVLIISSSVKIAVLDRIWPCSLNSQFVGLEYGGIIAFYFTLNVI